MTTRPFSIDEETSGSLIICNSKEEQDELVDALTEETYEDPEGRPMTNAEWNILKQSAIFVGKFLLMLVFPVPFP